MDKGKHIADDLADRAFLTGDTKELFIQRYLSIVLEKEMRKDTAEYQADLEAEHRRGMENIAKKPVT